MNGTEATSAYLPVERLTEKQAKAEHARLAEEIAGHDRRYYQDDAPTVSDAEYDELRRRYGAIEARFPQLAHRRQPDAAGRRGARGALRQGAARGADAVARQCLCRRRRGRFCRPHSPLSASSRRRGDRVFRRAEDRRPVDVAALRGRRTGHRRDARRWHRGRGRHRQRQDAGRHSEAAQRQRHSVGVRSARRSLHDQAGLSRPQQKTGGGRQAALCQSAQYRGRFVAPARRRDHRVAAARLFRLCLGRDERHAGRHAVRHDQVVRALRLQDQSADQDVPLGRGAAEISRARSKRSAPRSTTTSTASSTKSIASTGRSGSASCRAIRAGRSRTNSRPRRRPRSSRISRSRSAAPAR